jgi:alkylation response protein AidB-like acyl-CoA dehydrogenase
MVTLPRVALSSLVTNRKESQMNVIFARYAILTLLSIGIASINSFAGSTESKPIAAEVRQFGNPSTALSRLQEIQKASGRAFVVQNELDPLIREGGGGACASAAGMIVMQTLRQMADLEPVQFPHQLVLSSFSEQKELLNGRVTNDQWLRLISFYERHLDGLKVQVRIVSAPDSKHAGEGKKWSPEKGPDLRVKSGQLKIVSYTVTEPNGHELGRHFVILKENNKNEITVVDPKKPSKDYRYIVDVRKGTEGPRQDAFLTQAPGAPPLKHTYKINTIFTIALLPGEKGPVTLESVKVALSRTASELRGTPDFLSPQVWRSRTATHGLPGLDLPVDLGGSDWPATKMLEVFKHAGELNLNFRDVVGGGHVRPLMKSSHPEIREIVRQVASGEGYIAIAITEPEVGSDVTAIRSSCRKVDGGYLLSGSKRFNARLDQATHVIIFTQEAGGRPGKLSVFVVPINTPGLKIERLEAHGLVGNSYGGLTFKDMFVPESHLIGADGDGMRTFHDHFLYWRLMQAASAIGTGDDALRQMADRIKSRNAFGGPIGRFTHLQQALGQSKIELQMAYALARDAAEMLDRNEYKAAEGIICGLKGEGVEIALRAVDSAARAFGGEGYSTRVDIGDRLRDLNGLRIADGTTDVMRMNVVRHLFGQEFWDMAVEKK